MAARDEPFLSAKAFIAALTIAELGGWAAGFLGLAAFLALGAAAAASVMIFFLLEKSSNTNDTSVSQRLNYSLLFSAVYIRALIDFRTILILFQS